MERHKLTFTQSTYFKCLHVQRGEYEKTQHHVVTDGVTTARGDTRKKAESLFNVFIYAQPRSDYKPYTAGSGSWL